MTIAYDGRRYKGFRKTKKDSEKTIQGKLEDILRKKYEQAIEVIGAVNTDPGVSAKAQVVNFKTPDKSGNPKEIFEYFEEYLPHDIIVMDVEIEDERFHSRYMVDRMTYTYRLWKKDALHRPLFDRQLVNLMDRPLDIEAMRQAAGYYIGEHDYKAFTTTNKTKSSVKHVYDVDIEDSDNEIKISITANAFLLHMERIMVGTLVQVGLGDKHPETVNRAFRTLNSKDTGHKVMAGALMLEQLTFTDVKE